MDLPVRKSRERRFRSTRARTNWLSGRVAAEETRRTPPGGPGNSASPRPRAARPATTDLPDGTGPDYGSSYGSSQSESGQCLQRFDEAALLHVGKGGARRQRNSTLKSPPRQRAFQGREERKRDQHADQVVDAVLCFPRLGPPARSGMIVESHKPFRGNVVN